MKVELNGKFYTIPDTINDIPISKFHKIMEIEDEKEKGLQYFIQVFCILSDINYEYVLEFVSISSLKPIITFFDTFFKEKLSEKPLEFIEIDNDKYYLQDNEDLLTGEYIDIEAFIIDGMYKNIAKIASILYRKQGESYNKKTQRRKEKLFNDNLTIGQLYGSLLFFYRGEKAE